MGSGIYFPICALPFSILILILFFRRHIKTVETKIYECLMISNFLGIIVEIACTAASLMYKSHITFSNVILKLYLVYIVSWVLLFSIYLLVISNKKEYLQKIKNKARSIVTIIYWLIVAIIFILPIQLIQKNNNQIRYTSGTSVTFTYLVSSIFILFMIYCMITNYKNLKNKKYLPVFVFLIIGSAAMLFQMFNPGVLLVTYFETFITVIMYFTIENPDLKIVNELQKNRELVENSVEDKSVYLFKMTQQVKDPIRKMNQDIKELKETTNREEKAILFNELEQQCKYLTFTINNVLDASSMDLKNIKPMENSYNTNNLFEIIRKYTENKLKEKDNVKLFFNTNKTIPKELYGDSIKLKQVIVSIIDNAIKYTNEGIIDINIEGINRYDICRLVINITDSGCGIDIKKINDILNFNEELSEEDIKSLDNVDINLKSAIKVIKVLGGNMNIKSNVNEGTEVSIAIEQKVKLLEKSSLEKTLDHYTSEYSGKKVLLVNDSSEEINRIEKLLSKYEVNVKTTMYGRECIDKVKESKYGLIIIKDEMLTGNALPVLQELQKLPKFKTPVVVMLNKEKEFIKEHYLEEGFKDYILKEQLDSEIKRVIDRYIYK